MTAPPLPRWFRYLALVGVFLLGLSLRFYRLAEIPLGGHGDVAWNALQGLDWLRSGVWSLYIYHLYAPEPLIPYLDGLSAQVLFGANFFAARAVTSLASGVAILVGYQVIRHLGDGQPYRRAAWLFALACALSFYPIILSRSGQEAHIFPLLALALALLFAYAWRSRKFWAFAACAPVMAAANYAYIPGRLLPVLVVLWVGYEWLIDHQSLRARWKAIAAMLALSLLLVLPQIVMYLRTPEAFFARSDQSAGQLIFKAGLSTPDLLLTVGRKILGEFAIYLLPWSGAYAEMSQPLLPFILFVGVLAGIIAAVRRPRARALWWPMIAILVMILPDVVSGTQLDPHGLRMTGEIPFAFMLGAVGLAWLWLWAEQHFPLLRRPQVVGVALAVLIAGEGFWQFAEYFSAYIPALQADPITAERLEASDVFLTDLIRRHASDGLPILITLDDFTRSNITYLLSDLYPLRRSAIRADGTLDVPEGKMLLIWPSNPGRPRHDAQTPEHDRRGWVMLYRGQMLLLPPLSAGEGWGTINEALATTHSPLDTVSDWRGQAVAGAYAVELNGSDFDEMITPVNANLNHEVILAGYGADARRFQPGQPFWITLYWRPNPRLRDEYEFYVQVLDRGGNAVAKVHRWAFDGTYRTQLWRADELVPLRVALPIPADLPPGAYTVITGLYRALENTSLDVFDQAGNKVGDHVTLTGFKVPLPAAGVMLPVPEQPITFGGEIRLAGMQVSFNDHALTLGADWKAIKPPQSAHTLFVHVVGPDGKIVAQLDTQPLGGSYPTDVWDADEIVPETYTLALPPDLSPGLYRVYLGWYTLPSGMRLAAAVGGVAMPNDRVEVYRVQIP